MELLGEARGGCAAAAPAMPSSTQGEETYSRTRVKQNISCTPVGVLHENLFRCICTVCGFVAGKRLINVMCACVYPLACQAMLLRAARSGSVHMCSRGTLRVRRAAVIDTSNTRNGSLE